jgi:nicotinic acid mononucleotide adenylyltransferase
MKNIKEIHDSNLFGVIIEAGCSAAAASALMNIPGSSKSIYRCEQVHSKEYQESLYGKFKRSVSKEWIKQVLEVESKKSDKINFVLASSWQLIDPNDPLVYAHGWFGLYDMQRNVKHYLHFSFRRDFSRGYREITNSGNKKEYIEHKYAYDISDRINILDIIGQLACAVLHTAISGQIKSLTLLNEIAILDNAYIDNGIIEKINYDLLISTLEKAKGDYFLVFYKGEVIRIEDLMRKSNEFVIQKGSFNPIHTGHLRQITGTHEKYPNALPAFLISTFRYDKPHINYDELKERIDMFAKAGYPLIICKSVLFYETFSLLRKWSYGKNFFFTIGYDTLNRIYQTDVDFTKLNPKLFISDNLPMNIKEYITAAIESYKDKFKFLLFERKDFTRLEETHLYDDIVECINVPDDGISSTKIRNGEIENKLKL